MKIKWEFIIVIVSNKRHGYIISSDFMAISKLVIVQEIYDENYVYGENLLNYKRLEVFWSRSQWGFVVCSVRKKKHARITPWKIA